jgi:lipopolysaccharide transport system permease protein
VGLFVHRDFVSYYKQTILGPLWYLIQPLLATLTFTIVFGRIAGISTDRLPPFLFYMAGLIGWTYFADCLSRTSDTFVANAGLFGKIYFPRLCAPLSLVISGLIKFGIQFGFFLAFVLIYMMRGAALRPNGWIVATPLLVLMVAGLGLGGGIVISALTTKYRDLRFLLGFGVQLLMYATPVVYPLSSVSSRYRWMVLLNPMTPIIEAFRYAFLGSGAVSPLSLAYSTGVASALIFGGILLFNRVERTYMDTV